MRDDGNDAGSGNRGLFALARPRPVETVRRRNDIDFGRSAGKHDQKVADHPDLAPDHGVSRHNEPRVGPARAKKGTTPERVRSEERRGGNEGVSTCRSRGSPYHKKKKNKRDRRENRIEPLDKKN